MAGIALLPLLPEIARAADIHTVPVIASLLTITAALQRVLTIPSVAAWLDHHLPALAPAPKDKPMTPTDRDDDGVHASESDDDTVTVTDGAAPLVVAAEARTIAGRILPWGESGKTSAGALRFTPPAIRIPKDLSRVKLLRDHTDTTTGHSTPVGVMTAWESKPDGLYATFTIPATPDGDVAITEAQAAIRDSFSVEVRGLQRTGPDVTDSVLRAVALVPYPAYEGARIESIQASEHHTDDTADEDTDPAGTPDPDDTDDGAEDDTDPQEDPDMRDPVTPRSAVQVTEPVITASDVLDTIRAVRTGGDRLTEAHAAMVDITASSLTNAAPPAWLGEIWDGLGYTRQIVPLLTQRSLSNLRAVGYRWTTKPKVAPYAGDKAEVPSSPVAVSPIEVEAERWANANDIDRKFYDFNDTEVLSAYWRACGESYALETDTDAATWLATNATPLTTAADDLVRAVATGAIHVVNNTRAAATFALVHPLDLLSVLDLADLDAPRYGNLTPLSDPSSWTITDLIPQGSAIVGTRAAAEYFELPGSPLRAEAEHIAHGGRDVGLFGYTAKLITRADGIVSVPFGDTAPVVPPVDPETEG